LFLNFRLSIRDHSVTEELSIIYEERIQTARLQPVRSPIPHLG